MNTSVEIVKDCIPGGSIKVILEKGEDGYFVAHCPSLRSCWSQGKTADEALNNIKEAVELFVEPDAN